MSLCSCGLLAIVSQVEIGAICPLGIKGDARMAEKLLTENTRESLVSLLVLPVLIGPGIVVWQVYTWLRTAKWQPVAVSDALTLLGTPYPSFDWLGLQKITDALLDWPLSVFAFAIWLVAIVILMIFIEEAAKKKRANRVR
jgi:hypothetical protein